MLNLFIEHDIRTLARLAGAATAPDCDSVIVRHGDPSQVLASSHRGNPLRESWMLDVDSPGKRTIAWSGTLANHLFAADPRTWLRPGREAFARFCNELQPQLRGHGRTLCFHPHSRHVLNDVPSIMAFYQKYAAGDGQAAFEFALAPASMLEPAMLGDVDDHLRRQFESLGDTCVMVLLSDVRVIDGADGEPRCDAVPLGEGLLPRAILLELLGEFVPAATPIVIQGRSLPSQLQWLGCQPSSSAVSSQPS